MKEGSEEVEKSIGSERKMLNIIDSWKEEIGRRELQNHKWLEC